VLLTPHLKHFFIKNLPADVEEEEIAALFQDCGSISDMRMLNDKETGEFKRCGFLEFDDQESATKAFNLSQPFIRDFRVVLDYATPKNNDGGGGRGGRGGGRGGFGGGGGRFGGGGGRGGGGRGGRGGGGGGRGGGGRGGRGRESFSGSKITF